MLGETGNPLPVLASALVALRAIMPDALAFDEMLGCTMLMRPLDLMSSSEPLDRFPRPVTDIDVAFIQERLQLAGLKRLSKDVAHQAVDTLAYEGRYHPIQDYLNDLSWDGKFRLANIFPTYFGSDDTPYSKAISVPCFL